MNLKNQKKLAGKLVKASPKRVKIDPLRVEELKEAITKADLRGLIADGAITKEQKKGVSRARANKIKIQKSRGQRKGKGNRKASKTFFTPKKETWMKKMRVQRALLATLKEKGHIDSKTRTLLYRKVKGGFFRSTKHIKVYVQEHELAINKKQ
jgi:large subunit ribosomal protein L19e